jgi:hypothetical protein
MTTRTADSKGRVTLGERFANQPVIVREIDDTEVVVTLARVVPAREAWLLDSPKARRSIARGLAQARARKFAKPPDLKADTAIADSIEDDR